MQKTSLELELELRLRLNSAKPIRTGPTSWLGSPSSPACSLPLPPPGGDEVTAAMLVSGRCEAVAGTTGVTPTPAGVSLGLGLKPQFVSQRGVLYVVYV